MFAQPIVVPGLTVAGCRSRQARLRETLVDQNLDGALFSDRRHVYYFTGYWCRSIYSPLAFVAHDGQAWLSLPSAQTGDLAADTVSTYKSNHLCTLVDGQWNAALAPLATQISKAKRLGCDGQVPINFVEGRTWHDLCPQLWKLRRTKDNDEVAMIRCAVEVTDMAYRYAFETLRPGVTEVELFAGMQAAVADAVGETVGEFGNDFQIGSPMGPPRRKPAELGEMAVLDLTVIVRGYASDLSRSFVVGRDPSAIQREAFERVISVLEEISQLARPGARCRDLFEHANQRLAGYRGWRFGHHLGHGIGLCPHEAPRLNPNWDDTLQAGDVFTVEPGLYADELRGGLRIEQDFHLSADRLETLSQFPIDMA